MARVARPLFVLSGIGADERLFDAQRAVRDIRPIRWTPPVDVRETLSRYGARLARELAFDEPFDLGGASFGGMVALELARHLEPRQVFLFGSCRSPDAGSRQWRPIGCCMRRACCCRALRAGLVRASRVTSRCLRRC